MSSRLGKIITILLVMVNVMQGDIPSCADAAVRGSSDIMLSREISAATQVFAVCGDVTDGFFRLLDAAGQGSRFQNNRNSNKMSSPAVCAIVASVRSGALTPLYASVHLFQLPAGGMTLTILLFLLLLPLRRRKRFSAYMPRRGIDATVTHAFCNKNPHLPTRADEGFLMITPFVYPGGRYA